MRSLVLFAVFVPVACSRTETPPASAPAPATGTEPVTTPATSPSASAPAPSKAGPPGAMCGGIAGFGCAEGSYCAFPPEAHCGAADQSGTCTVVPQMCTKEFAPVCGCDDKTYPNACTAATAGVSVSKPRACDAP